VSPFRDPSPIRLQTLRHDRRYAIDATKIASELGWKPSATFEQGIRDTVAWYLANEGWINRVQSGAYRRERLGVSV
jgi:dTDP-glucose 4,6-dehydratase